MSNVFSYRSAALLVAISAVLHLISPAFADLDSFTQILLAIGVVYLVFAWGLTRRVRWLAHLAYCILLVGICFAFAYSFGGSPLPGWLFAAIALIDLAAIICLFVILWKPKAITA